MTKNKLAVIVTHPIQYYAPVFKLLAKRSNIIVRVYYTWGEQSISKYDPGFGKTIEWDLPLLDGYDHEFLQNTSTDPGSHHFRGIENPDSLERIKSWDPDALLVYGWSYKSHLKILRYFKGRKKILFRGDSNLIDDLPGWKSALRTIFLKWIYRNIDKALYVGSANKAYYKEYGLKEDQLIFAPHAIDNDRFAEDRSEESAQLRSSLGLSKDDILILFAGKFEHKKAPELLLQAFLGIENKRAHLLMVGNGVLESELRELSNSSLTSAEKVHFLSFQNQGRMPVIYQAADIFCLPSNGPGETWGLAVNEAMAAGKAVVVSNKVGCAQDLVVNDLNGYVFQSGNSEQLNEALLKCIERYGDMGRSSFEIIKSWSFIKQAEAIENAV